MIYFVRRISHLLKAHLIHHIPSSVVAYKRKCGKELSSRCSYREIKKARLIFVSGITTAVRTRISERESSDTFRRILFRRAWWKQRCGSRKNNNGLPLPADATTPAWYHIENFSQRHVSFSNYSERSRSRWKEEGRQWRAHFNQALIELKTRILLREPQKFYAAAPSTDAILQVIRAQGCA